ncbi:MAG: glucosaminidase domain-containing protein [Bacteroidales bacterium]
MPHPVSLAIAQAAIESAWGTSRFFLEGRNAFGVWSFSEDDSRMIANETREGRPVFLKKYNSLIDSAEDYYLVLSRGPFSDFREVRATTNDVFELLPNLTKYSEQENSYARKLNKIINKNKLIIYDSYQIDPKYILDD